MPERDHYFKSGARWLATGNGDRPLVLLDHFLHHGQAQASARRLGGEVRVKDFSKLVRWDTSTRVADGNAHRPLLGRFNINLEYAIRANRLDGIEIQIQQHLSEAIGIDLHQRQSSITTGTKGDIVTLSILTDQVQRMFDHLVNRHPLQTQIGRAHQRQ
ncbi:hypothetical protein D3C76_1379820 [compost metagenome]